MTGLHEFAWKFFGYGFYDLIDESKSQMFWDFIGELRQTVEIEAASYSQKLGLNTPHTCTTMKPSGSISKLYALTEGAHLAARKFYLRWVQFQNNDPLLEQYREEGYPVKELTTYPNISIVGFPTRPLIASLGMKDKLVTAQEASPEDQYKWLMLLEKYWLGEGNNQISYCLAGDKKHLITTSTGFRRIENMVKSEVPDRFGEKQNVIDLIENGKKETIKMTLTNGLYIQGTKDHKVLTLDNFNNYVWTRLEDLRINDLVLRRKNDNIFSSTYSLLPQNTYSRNNFKDITIPEKVTNEFAEFLGMLMSDGSINENGFCLHNEDLEVLDRFGFLVKSLFGITGIRKRDLNTQKMYDFEFYSRELTHWLLYDLKIPKYHDDNYILDCILQSPKSAIQAFIKGHTLDGYNCEDYLYPLCTVSKQMAYDICILMISMGYNASVSYKEGREYYFTETNQGIGKSQYSVRIPKTEISKFLQEIKFAEERKNVEANLNIKDKNIKNNGKDNLLFFNPFKEYYLKNKKTMSNKYGPKFNRLMYQDRRFISKEKAYEFFGDIDEFKHIFEDKNIISTPVKSVEIIDALIHTYDISVEESHEYLANTIIVHNTLKISTEKYTLEEFRETFKKYQSKIRCCSVLPLASNTELKTLYEYLPEEDVTEEYFMEIQNRIRKNNDVGFAMSELMCDGGACPL
jgi:intein/homing endonuclease